MSAVIGARERRLDGDRYVTGRIPYIADFEPAGLMHMAVLRSPLAHALIRGIDVSGALELGFAVRVVTGPEILQLTQPIPFRHDPATWGGKRADIRCLATDKVTYVGQPVAAVVAPTQSDAAAALEAIRVEYEELPGVFDVASAMRPGAPLLYGEWGDNIVVRGHFLQGDPETAIAEAPESFRFEIGLGRSTSAPIETRGYVASWDSDQEAITLYGTCQNPHPLRWVLSQALCLSESKVRVVASNLGGAFGLKMHGHPEEVLVCVLSRLVNAPVKWIESRTDCFLAGGREQRHYGEVGFDSEGRILGLRVRFMADVGALSATPGWGMAVVTGLTYPSGYRIPNCDVAYATVVTNKPPWNPTRGYGKEATNLVMERILDMVARRLRLDPAEARRRNLIPAGAFPYRTATGLNIDSGDYVAVLDEALELANYEAWRERQRAQPPESSVRLGVGIAFELTPEAAALPGTLSGGFDTATVRMDPSGNVTVLTGVTSPGGGNETGIAQVVASELGVPMGSVSVLQGDTQTGPYGFGNSSGRSIVVGASAAALAARDLRAKLAVVAAEMLGSAPEEVVFAGGVAEAHGRSLPLPDLARTICRRPYLEGQKIEPLLEASRAYRPGNIRHTPDEAGLIQPYPTYSNAVHVAAVEVDTETGQIAVLDYAVVHDCGVMINPSLVEGQMHGAVAMGIGAALYERVAFDDAGRPQTLGFKTYLMPRSLDLPAIRIGHHVTPSPFTELGTKGAGEAGVGGAVAAIANAVDDALAGMGASVTQVPLLPEVILDLLETTGPA